MNKKSFYRELVTRYAANKATPNEVELLFNLLKQGELDQSLHDEMNLAAGISDAPVKRMFFWKRVAAAAILVIIVTSAYFIFFTKPAPKIAESPNGTEQLKHDASPGGNRAVLTLGNGQKILLDSAQVGKIASQGNANILKSDSGKLAYHLQNGKSTEILYNTLATPRGGQFQLVLPDGTKVWLDASSSITYPTAFTGMERKVEATGQLYFEVVHKDDQPFVVTSGGLEIKDIGTAFNINTYSDEPIARITLAEGSAEVRKKNQSIILKPGQQIQSSGAKVLTLVPEADVEQALAWKNGMIKLGGTTIHEIMRQLSRWYDVDISYEGNLDKAVFSGVVSRKQNASGLIRILEATGSVHFVIEDKKITVKP